MADAYCVKGLKLHRIRAFGVIDATFEALIFVCSEIWFEILYAAGY